jgi:hypothetical protein
MGKEEKEEEEESEAERGRRTLAAHPAEMRLGSNRILHVGKQEDADARSKSYELSWCWPRVCPQSTRGSCCVLAPPRRHLDPQIPRDH